MENKWPVRKLGDICEVLNGFAFKSDKYVDEGVRIIRITNVQHGYIEDNDPKFYPIDECERLNQYMLKEQDLLMSLTGNVGRVGLMDNKFLPAALNQRVACLRVKNENVELKYLFHHLNSELFETRCIQSAKGIAQKNMSTEWLKEYPIPIPPLSEQSRIVEELDQLSNIIEKKRQQLSELDNLAQSIFYDMFGDPIKASYTKMPLKELAENIGDGLHGTPNYSDDGDCYFINGNNLEDGKIVVSNSTKKVDKKEKDKYFIELNTKTILVSINGTLGKIAYYNNENVILGKSACYIKLKEGINKVYIYNILCSDYFKRYAQDNATGSTIRNVSLKSMRNLLIPIPPLEKQDDYMNKIEAIEKEKELIKQSIKETEELFNSRMDYYFG